MASAIRTACLSLLFAGIAQACDPDSIAVTHASASTVLYSQHPMTNQPRWEQWWRYWCICNNGEPDTLEIRQWPLRCPIEEPEPETVLAAQADTRRDAWELAKQNEHDKFQQQFAKFSEPLDEDNEVVMQAFADSCLDIGGGITKGQIRNTWRWSWGTFPHEVYPEIAADSLFAYWSDRSFGLEPVDLMQKIQNWVERNSNGGTEK